MILQSEKNHLQQIQTTWSGDNFLGLKKSFDVGSQIGNKWETKIILLKYGDLHFFDKVLRWGVFKGRE